MSDDPVSGADFAAGLAAVDEAFPPAMMTVRDDSIRLWRLEEKARMLGAYVAELETHLVRLEA